MDVALRRHCQKQKAALLAERALYEPDWRTVGEYLDPYAARHLFQQNGGQRRLPSRAKILNSRASKALRTMDAGFMGGHTSKSRPWFRLGVTDTKLADTPGVREWLDDVTAQIRDVLARSNFYTELPDFYHERHSFGVSAMACEEDPVSIVRFYQRSIGTYAMAVDYRGRCNVFWYCFEYTAAQIKEMVDASGMGTAALPRQVIEAIEKSELQRKFLVESLIEPNPDGVDDGRAHGPSARPFRQVYWIEGHESDQHGCLEMGGHYEHPILASRWNANGSDVYGTSPALDALGDIKQLQYLESEKLRLTDHTTKPTMAVPEYLRNKGASLNPGERVYLTPMQVQQKVEPIYTPHPGSIQQLREEIETVGERVDQAFFADLFRMLDFLDDRERTAYEISERKEEKVAMLGPALESLTDEVLDPSISRVFGVLDRRGMLPPPPPALDGVPIKVEYTSILAQAMKAAGVAVVERVIGIVGNLAAAKAADPSGAFDKINTDATIEAIHEALGAPARMLNSDEDVAAIRQGRAQQMQQQQAAAMAPAMKQGAEAMRTLGEAKAAEGSMLEKLAAGMPAGAGSVPA